MRPHFNVSSESQLVIFSWPAGDLNTKPVLTTPESYALPTELLGRVEMIRMELNIIKRSKSSIIIFLLYQTIPIEEAFLKHC